MTTAKSRLLTIAEVVGVLLPLNLGLVFNHLYGSDHITLYRSTVILQGPITYLGLLISVLILVFVMKKKGESLADFGMGKPGNWTFVILKALVVSVCIFGLVRFLINPLMIRLPGPGRDMSMYERLHRNLPNLLINLTLMYVTVAFIEEFLYRGYLIHRLAGLLGGDTTAAWISAAVLAGVLFGIPHVFQGFAGIFKTALIGIILGFFFIAFQKKLWPLIIAHCFIDTLDFISHYVGE